MKRTKFISHFRSSEDGAILVFVAVALSVMIGMAAIAFDMGRVTTTQAELQSFVDNVALAAAGELDGQGDSISRATSAAANMIHDTQTFGLRNKDQLLSGDTDYQLFFYEYPPTNETEPAQPAQLLDPAEATSGTLAAFVRVVADTHEVDTPLAAATASLVGGSFQFASVNAEAVAGFTLMACDITPMFICLPSNSELTEGQMVKMVSQGGGNEQWGPGNFGFLASNQSLAIDTSGACAPAPPGQQDSCALAASRAVSMCFSQRGVETRPGLSVGNMIAGFNTRFDRYEASAGQFQNEKKYAVDNFASSPHVLDGWITSVQGNQCNSEPAPPYEVDGVIDPTATVGLPLDDCFDDGTCPTSRIGNGNFAAGLNNYLTINYGSDFTDPTAPTNIPSWFPTDGTRYEIYNKEIANQDALQTILTGAGKAESSLPNCQPPSPSHADPRRRVITVAGIDCGANQSELNGGSGVIPVARFIEMFLVRPSESDGTGAAAVIYGEVIQSVGQGIGGSGTGGIVHDLVQLYE